MLVMITLAWLTRALDLGQLPILLQTKEDPSVGWGHKGHSPKYRKLANGLSPFSNPNT